jgi:hypothetical protein
MDTFSKYDLRRAISDSILLATPISSTYLVVSMHHLHSINAKYATHAPDSLPSIFFIVIPSLPKMVSRAQFSAHPFTEKIIHARQMATTLRSSDF